MLQIGNNLVSQLADWPVIQLNPQTRKPANPRTHKGFTLIEIMVAVAVLSLGIVMLYEAFFTCLYAYSYSTSHLDVRSWMDEKLWEMQDTLVRLGTLTTGEYTGSFFDRNKKFTWQMSIDLIEELEDAYLYRITLEVCWKEMQRDVSLSQVAYVQN